MMMTLRRGFGGMMPREARNLALADL